jgi:uncharacterized protein (TIGR03435 family)
MERHILTRMGIAIVTILGCLQSPVSAQPQTPLAFEVASVKPSGPQSFHGTDGGPGSSSPELFRAGSAPLRLLICIAWNIDCYFQISSKASLDKGEFDIVARVLAGATKEQFRVMLQNLLIDRFGLKMHIESKEFPAYEMIVTKSGLKLKEAVPGETNLQHDGEIGWPVLPPNRATMAALNSISGGYQLVRIRAQQQALAQLAKMLQSGSDEPPIVDQTGLSAKYNFTLEYVKDPLGATPDSPPPAPLLTTALQQQLGLQLVSKRLPFDVVVVESVKQVPTEN